MGRALRPHLPSVVALDTNFHAVRVLVGLFFPLPVNAVNVLVGLFVPLPVNAVSVLVSLFVPLTFNALSVF